MHATTQPARDPNCNCPQCTIARLMNVSTIGPDDGSGKPRERVISVNAMTRDQWEAQQRRVPEPRRPIPWYELSAPQRFAASRRDAAMAEQIAAGMRLLSGPVRVVDEYADIARADWLDPEVPPPAPAKTMSKPQRADVASTIDTRWSISNVLKHPVSGDLGVVIASGEGVALLVLKPGNLHIARDAGEWATAAVVGQSTGILLTMAK